MNKELIDRNHFVKSINESIAEAQKWGASAQNDEIKIRAEQAIATFCEASLRARQMPTIDAVPVVRCKDCKWFNPEIEFGEIRIGTCPYQPPYEHTHGEGYCFRGVRREDNENCN